MFAVQMGAKHQSLSKCTIRSIIGKVHGLDSLVCAEWEGKERECGMEMGRKFHVKCLKQRRGERRKNKTSYLLHGDCIKCNVPSSLGGLLICSLELFISCLLPTDKTTVFLVEGTNLTETSKVHETVPDATVIFNTNSLLDIGSDQSTGTDTTPTTENPKEWVTFAGVLCHGPITTTVETTTEPKVNHVNWLVTVQPSVLEEGLVSEKCLVLGDIILLFLWSLLLSVFSHTIKILKK